ncbi:MAG: type II toxin-antitoxin system PemK/MazF family toxin [Acidimicrobiales bacterium]|nr:type II toxin-antitoxin system PemK/MazF family toxin [Acidimicrobiales bacterium]
MASVDELWLTDFGDPFPGEPAFHRPALVVGPPSYFGADFPFVLVVPLTTTDRGLSLHVEIEANSDTGLETASHAQCELLRSVNRRRLVHRLGTIDSTTNEQVSEILATLLSL